MLSVCVLLSSFDAMLMNGGICMLILPNGPAISTVLLGSLRLTTWFLAFVDDGSRMRNVTSGGNESGARPILDRQGELVEKCDCCGVAFGVREGARNASMDTSLILEVLKTVRRALVEREQCSDEAIEADY